MVYHRMFFSNMAIKSGEIPFPGQIARGFFWSRGNKNTKVNLIAYYRSIVTIVTLVTIVTIVTIYSNP